MVLYYERNAMKYERMIVETTYEEIDSVIKSEEWQYYKVVSILNAQKWYPVEGTVTVYKIVFEKEIKEVDHIPIRMGAGYV